MKRRLAYIPLVTAILLVPTTGWCWNFTLTLNYASTATITFPDQDPDLFPMAQQVEAPVHWQVTTTGLPNGTRYSCTLQARGPLTSAVSTIPASSITWSAANLVYDATQGEYIPTSGTVSDVSPVLVGYGYGKDTGGSPLAADLTFRIQNMWTYATGSYTQTMDFVVTSP